LIIDWGLLMSNIFNDDGFKNFLGNSALLLFYDDLRKRIEEDRDFISCLDDALKYGLCSKDDIACYVGIHTSSVDKWLSMKNQGAPNKLVTTTIKKWLLRRIALKEKRMKNAWAIEEKRMKNAWAIEEREKMETSYIVNSTEFNTIEQVEEYLEDCLVEDLVVACDSKPIEITSSIIIDRMENDYPITKVTRQRFQVSPDYIEHIKELTLQELKEIELEDDPEYQKHLELKKKFEE
jgi:hypothetical protein